MENTTQKDLLQLEAEDLFNLAVRKPNNWTDLVIQSARNIRAILDTKPDEFYRGFDAGRKAIARDKNSSRCCCVLDDGGNIIKVCKAHADWKKQAEDRVRIQALEGIIEILTKLFVKSVPPEENTVDIRALGRFDSERPS